MTKKEDNNMSELPPSLAKKAFLDAIMEGIEESRRPKLKVSSLGPFQIASIETKKIGDLFGQFIKLKDAPALPPVLELFRKLGTSERDTKRRMRQLIKAILEVGIDSWKKDGGGELSLSVFKVLIDTYQRAQFLLAPLVQAEVEREKNSKGAEGTQNFSPDDWAVIAETMRTIGKLEAWAYFALYENDVVAGQNKTDGQRKHRRDSKTTKLDKSDRNQQIRREFFEKKQSKPKSSKEAIRRALGRDYCLSPDMIRKIIEGTKKRKHPRLK